jgi:hypothetical protein
MVNVLPLSSKVETEEQARRTLAGPSHLTHTHSTSNLIAPLSPGTPTLAHTDPKLSAYSSLSCQLENRPSHLPLTL